MARKQTAAQRAASLRNLAKAREAAKHSSKAKAARKANLVKAREAAKKSPKAKAARLANLAKARLAALKSPKARAVRLANLAKARAARAAKMRTTARRHVRTRYSPQPKSFVKTRYDNILTPNSGDRRRRVPLITIRQELAQRMRYAVRRRIR